MDPAAKENEEETMRLIRSELWNEEEEAMKMMRNELATEAYYEPLQKEHTTHRRPEEAEDWRIGESGHSPAYYHWQKVNEDQ